MSMDDLERGLHLVAENSDRARFVGPRDPDVVSAAEAALGVRFPPTYRRFLTDLGAGSLRGEEFYGVIDSDWGASPPDGIGITLGERSESGLPERYIVVGDTGSGDRYVIDTSESDDDGENPVHIVMPGVDPEEAGPPERVADDFGAFFNELISEAVA